jgi:cholesterol transport system auxiliary component
MKPYTFLFAALTIVLALGGCVGSPTKSIEVAQYDLGSSATQSNPPALALRGIDVQAPSWLGTPAMQYRLSYANAERRQAFAESRWAAPPSELLEVSLRRQLVATATGSCRLRLELDEFAQVFDAPGVSRSVLEARASLVAGKGDQVLARRTISLNKAAASADARGGVGAFAGLALETGKNLTEWLATLSTNQAALVAPCRQ